MQKKILLPLLIALIPLTPAYAASTIPSPSLTPSPSPVSDEVVTENLKKRLQETLEITENNSVSTYKSFVGVIRDVIKNTLVVEDKDGKKNVVIKDTANIVRSPGNAAIKAENVRIDDYIIAIGTLKDSDELDAVRIIVSTDPLSSINKRTGAAKITKINKTELTLTPLQSGDPLILTLTAKTKLKTSMGESLESSELSVGDSVIFTAISAKDDLTATSLMRIGFASPETSLTPLPSPTN